MKIRIILADDHPLVVAGAAHYLAGMETMVVVGTARDSGEVMEQLNRMACDVLISGYSMPNGKYGDGIAYFSHLRRRYPNLKIIAYTAIEDPTLVSELARIGVRAVVSKASHMEHLVAAINAVFVGNTFFFQNAPAIEEENRSAASGGKPIVLTVREAEVMRLISSGLTIDEIARKLCRSKKTISSQKVAAKRKLGIKHDADLFRASSSLADRVARAPRSLPLIPLWSPAKPAIGASEAVALAGRG